MADGTESESESPKVEYGHPWPVLAIPAVVLGLAAFVWVLGQLIGPLLPVAMAFFGYGP
jgi:hypothetical protein